mgnify:CR=1 FL=1
MIIKLFMASFIIFSQHLYSSPIFKSTIFKHDSIYSDTSRFMNHSASIAVKDSIYYCSWFTAELLMHDQSHLLPS